MGLIGKKGCCGQQRKGKGIMNNKKNLKMKPVGSEYMEQYNALLRYVFQVTEMCIRDSIYAVRCKQAGIRPSRGNALPGTGDGMYLAEDFQCLWDP